MFKRPHNNDRRNKNYQVKKGGIKEAMIDRQVLVIHKAIAEKLLAYNAKGDRSLISQTLDVIDRRRDEGRMRYGELLTWQSLLDLIDDPQSFMSGMLEDSWQMSKYRRRTPFVGILTEEERQNALEKDAVGEIGTTLF